MIKVEVSKEFTLERFEELKNIVRHSREQEGKLFVGDTFECSKDLCDYLTGGNSKNITVVKVIEVIPEHTKDKSVGEIKTVERIEKSTKEEDNKPNKKRKTKKAKK